MAFLGIALASALLACTGGDGRPTPVLSADAGVATALALDGVAFAELTIPQNSRDGRPIPDAAGIRGWRGEEEGDGYWARMPVRPRVLFNFRAPDGFVLLGPDDQPVRHQDGDRPYKPGWSFEGDEIHLDLPKGARGPADGEWKVSYPAAHAREARLNFDASGFSSPEAFVRATLQLGPVSRTGLLLPAPAVAAWDVPVPPAGELHFTPGLLAPEVDDGPASDGATLVVEVESNGEKAEIARIALTDHTFTPRHLDLTAYSGKTVRLRVRIEPGASAQGDYVFLGEPVVAGRKSDPKRVVLIFVDTERVDHLSLYGYHRDTDPSLVALSKSAAVFTQARSTAPWTLPSTRSLLTGNPPEAWGNSETLQRRLAGDGWATAMFAGNVYLSSNFDMNRDWGLHFVENDPTAAVQVDRALAWLAENRDRDALMLVHFMDAHLPYDEPDTYRHLFASDPHPLLGEVFARPEVTRHQERMDERAKQYVRDRYDNNLRYVHDEIGRLLLALEEDDIVVYFADHGEEFWDHQGFEHGHTLFDELLHVPLVIRVPDSESVRVDPAVSLEDVTPTVLAALDRPAEGLHGVSLLPAIRGEEGALAALTARDVWFGHPLYGSERWGVLHDGLKYTTTEGREVLFDLTKDHDEKSNVARAEGPAVAEQFRQRLGKALGREVVFTYRLVNSPSRNPGKHDITVDLTVPGGIARAWVGEDATGKSSATVEVDGEKLHVAWSHDLPGTREIFFAPASPMAEVTLQLGGVVRQGEDEEPIVVEADRPPLPANTKEPLARVRMVSGRQVALTFAITPLPGEQATEIRGYDPEVAAMLRAMGYAVGNDASVAPVVTPDGVDGPDIGTNEDTDPGN